MSRINILSVVFIFCVYTKIIWCNQIYQPKCYTEPAESCPIQTKCKCVKTDDNSLFCCQVQSNEDLARNIECSGVTTSTMRALHIYNMTAEQFHFGKLEFHNLLSFSITSSYINRLFGRLDHTQEITCLNLSNNAFGAEWQDPLALESLKKLAMLDLSKVNISTLPNLDIQVSRFALDITNNTKMKCESVFELIRKQKQSNYKLVFVNYNETYCIKPSSFHWFNSTDKVALSQVEKLKKLEEDCPKNCSCKWYGLQMIQDTNPLHTVEVHCSNSYLSNLPEKLPENTVILNVTNNNITSIEPLVSDPTYKSLMSFYADNNNISNIFLLEGSRFMDNYYVLSLKSNQLKTVPIYILQNSFTKNYDGHRVYLGGNELLCDCSSAQSLKIWLLTNTKFVPDYDDILCENVPYRLKVIDLDQKIVCIKEADWTHYMYYVIAAELSVFLLLIAKVSYDYWVFKTAGYLPWPASKMPKLPCDWVFE